MGIWDKSKALQYPALMDTFPAGVPFTLLGMELSEPIDLGTELGPTPVVHCTIRGAQNVKNDGGWSAYGPARKCSIISGPIIEMAEHASDSDFPVVCAWEEVAVKTANRQAAKVLRLISEEVDVGVPESEGPTA